MVILRDTALLLRRTPFGESSLVVQALTERHGRVHLLAKGAHRPRSRYFCVLDLFDTLDLEWSENPRSELGLLRNGRLLERRSALSGNLDRYRAALAVLELCELAARPGTGGDGLFQICKAALDELQSAARPPDLALVVFELQFLSFLGLSPALEHCAVCGGPAPEISPGRAAFSAGRGGRLCAAHAEEARAAGGRVGTIPVTVLGTAFKLGPQPHDTSLDQLRPGDLLDRVRDLIERFIDYHLETRPASQRSFLSSGNRNMPELGPPLP